MGKISADQLNVEQLKKLSRLAPGVSLPADPPVLSWVVWEGETVVGIFPDWESASTLIGRLFQEQQARFQARAKELATEKDFSSQISRS